MQISYNKLFKLLIDKIIDVSSCVIEAAPRAYTI